MTVAVAGKASRESRGVVVMISGLLLCESSIYSAITPLLPHYARVFHALKPAIGLLAASYAAGLIPGALLGGWMAGRAGVRRTTLPGCWSSRSRPLPSGSDPSSRSSTLCDSCKAQRAD